MHSECSFAQPWQENSQSTCITSCKEILGRLYWIHIHFSIDEVIVGKNGFELEAIHLIDVCMIVLVVIVALGHVSCVQYDGQSRNSQVELAQGRCHNWHMTSYKA